MPRIIAPTSRQLLDLKPGSTIFLGEESFTLVGNPWCNSTGKPGIHRIGMYAIRNSEAGAFIAAHGWHRARPYYKPRMLHGQDITAVEPQEELT